MKNIQCYTFLAVLFSSYVAATIYMWRTRLKNPDEEFPCDE